MISRSNQYARQIEEYVTAHRQELVDILIELISVPSVKGPAQPGMPYGENCARALAKAPCAGKVISKSASSPIWMWCLSATVGLLIPLRVSSGMALWWAAAPGTTRPALPQL